MAASPTPRWPSQTRAARAVSWSYGFSWRFPPHIGLTDGQRFKAGPFPEAPGTPSRRVNLLPSMRLCRYERHEYRGTRHSYRRRRVAKNACSMERRRPGNRTRRVEGGCARDRTVGVAQFTRLLYRPRAGRVNVLERRFRRALRRRRRITSGHTHPARRSRAQLAHCFAPCHPFGYSAVSVTSFVFQPDNTHCCAISGVKLYASSDTRVITSSANR